MFGLFGGKKGKSSQKGGKAAPPAASGKTINGMTREQIIAQAQANAKAAREEIGQENLAKMMEAIMRDNKSPGSKARDQIRGMDKGRVADHVKILMEDEDN
jgi:hypothetical protein